MCTCKKWDCDDTCLCSCHREDKVAKLEAEFDAWKEDKIINS